MPLSLLTIKERKLYAIAWEENKQVLKRGETCDLYIVVEGDYTDPTLNIAFNVNGKDNEISIQNVPYTRQEFKVFMAEGKNYTSITIEEYWRD